MNQTIINFDVAGWNLPEMPAAEQVIPGQQISSPMIEALGVAVPSAYLGDVFRVEDERLLAFRTAHHLEATGDGPRRLCYHSLIDGEGACKAGRRCSLVSEFGLHHERAFRLAGSKTRSRTDVYTTQPYGSPTALGDMQHMATVGAAYGLETWLAPRQAWHLPGRTTLIVVVHPGVISLLDNDQSPSFVAASA